MCLFFLRVQLLEEQRRIETQGTDYYDLQARIEEAEAAAAEAEAVAQEAVNMLEVAEEERAKFEAQVAQLKRDLEWKEKKELKERGEWEARINDSFK